MDLFLQDISKLADELSMMKCGDEFRDKCGEHLEPYRFVVKIYAISLQQHWLIFDDHLSNRTQESPKAEIVLEDNQL